MKNVGNDNGGEGGNVFQLPSLRLFLLSDACWLALWADALINLRALFERSELARYWVSVVLATFPERKVDRLPGRDPAAPKTMKWEELAEEPFRQTLYPDA